MSLGKAYSIREKVIDRMLHTERGASLKELFDACNDALYDAGWPEVKSLNTITADITNISNRYNDYARHRGEDLIETYKDPDDARRVLYRYSNPDFSIYNVNLNDDVIQELQKAINLLSGFKYLPVASWVSEMDMRLRNVVFNNSRSNAVIEFDQDPKYAGNRLISPLYDAIMARQTIEIDFSVYGQKPQVMTLWPYYLKQYQHMWFLMATHTDTGQLDSIPLGHIKDIRNSDVPYKKCRVDLSKYFAERVGITSLPEHQEHLKVRFWASDRIWQELTQVPIHRSQILLGEASGGYIFEIEVCYNHELVRSLMQYGCDLVVLQPSDLRLAVAQAIGGHLNQYGFDVDLNALNIVVPNNTEIMDYCTQHINYVDRATGREVPTLLVTVQPDEFDRIRSGEQTELIREVRPMNIDQHLQLDENGFELEDENLNAIPVHYDAILLQDGYDKNCRALMISVQSARAVMLVDDNDELITYRYDEKDWIAEQVVYTLGPILKNKVKRVRFRG